MPVHQYTHGDVTVTYDPDICTHAARCVKGLPQVFDANRDPWVDPGAASYEAIAAQVAKCPSRALGISRN